MPSEATPLRLPGDQPMFLASLSKTASAFAVLKFCLAQGRDIRSRGFLRRYYGENDIAQTLIALYDQKAAEAKAAGQEQAADVPSDPSLMEFICHHGGLPYSLAPPARIVRSCIEQGRFWYDRWCQERADLAEAVKNVWLPFEPGSKYCYSEVFLTCMSCLLQEVDGVTFPELYERAFPAELGVRLRTDVHHYMAPGHGWFANADTVKGMFEWLMKQPEWPIMTETPFARNPFVRVGVCIESDTRIAPLGVEWWWGGEPYDWETEQGEAYFVSMQAFPAEGRVSVSVARGDYIKEPLPPLPADYQAAKLPNPGYARHLEAVKRTKWEAPPPEVMERFAKRTYTALRPCGDAVLVAQQFGPGGTFSSDGKAYRVAWKDGRAHLLGEDGGPTAQVISSFVWYDLSAEGQDGPLAIFTGSYLLVGKSDAEAAQS